MRVLTSCGVLIGSAMVLTGSEAKRPSLGDATASLRVLAWFWQVHQVPQIGRFRIAQGDSVPIVSRIGMD